MRRTVPSPFLLAVIAVFGLVGAPARAGEARIAVASNFQSTAVELGRAFAARGEHRVVFSYGATGALYAQIVNGAPFDAFLAADVERPRRLVARGAAVAASRFTYAVGRLVLWSRQPGRVDARGRILRSDRFRRLAIADPQLAPYGRAARQALTHMGLWQALAPRLVRGRNIAQAYQFVATGNAELGFVARSQLVRPDGGALVGSLWRVPPAYYAPIEQQAVRLTDAAAAVAFLAFCRSGPGRRIIRSHGYDLPAGGSS